MRFLFKTDYNQDIRLAQHGGHTFWYSLLGLFLVTAPWVMQELELYRLYATVLGFNIGSAQVLRKNGFLEEGVQRAAVFKRGVLHDLRVFAKVRRNLDEQ